MKCETCGVEGHDSQGSKELCLTAVVDRLARMESVLEEISKLQDSDWQDEGKTHQQLATHALGKKCESYCKACGV
jgi:hypothetical protein